MTIAIVPAIVSPSITVHYCDTVCLECGNGECYGRCVDVLEEGDSMPITQARANVSMQRRRVDQTDEAHLRKVCPILPGELA